MADLISREALLEKFQLRITCDNYATQIIRDCVEMGRKYIEDAPAVDAVGVVRCKDCERMSEKYGEHVCSHALPTKSLTQYLVMGTDILAIVQPDDFCSRGKRREENENHT